MVRRVAAKVAVVGAGYAGLACAVELADAGIGVDVFEASRSLGGRARAVEQAGMTIDNGSHILVGAYHETQRLMRKVGCDDRLLKRQPLHLEFANGFRLAAPRLPAPLHMAWALLTAHGLSWHDKLAAMRFIRAIKRVRFRLPADITARQLIANQPPVLRQFLWEPLCLAALNTPVASASAQVFLNVMRDSLAAERTASDLLLPATDFSRLFPEPAARFIETAGCRLFRSTRIRSMQKVDAGWTVDAHGPYRQIVLAVAPFHLQPLLAHLPEFAPLLGLIRQFHWQPIATIYLQYRDDLKLPFPMLGLAAGHAQWLFDRGALCGQAGLIAAVISGTGPWQALSHEDLARAVQQEIVHALPGWPQPSGHQVIVEKRATFACTPHLQRPPTATAQPSVWLAGDYVAGDYPATLEGAVRSGVKAARAILGALN